MQTILRRKSLAAGALVVILGVTNAIAGVLFTPVRVLGGPEWQETAYGNGTYLGWSQNSVARPNVVNAYISDDGGSTKQRVNRAGTQGWFGDLDQDSTEAIYQEIDHGQSNIQMIDLATRVRTDPPSGVNTNAWEWSPRFSDAFILFQRDNLRTDRRLLILYDRVTETTTTLADVNRHRVWLFAYDVGATHATWEMFARNRWTAWIYDIGAATKAKIPTVNGRPQYAPVVDELHGNAYWVRGRANGCGLGVRILSAPMGSLSTPTVIASLPNGIDAYTISLEYDSINARIDLLFTRVRCSGQRADIYELQAVDVLP